MWKIIGNQELPQEVKIEKGTTKEIILPIEPDNSKKELEINWRSNKLEDSYLDVAPDQRRINVEVPSDFTDSNFYLEYEINTSPHKKEEIYVEVTESLEGAKQEINDRYSSAISEVEELRNKLADVPNKKKIMLGEKFNLSLPISNTKIEWSVNPVELEKYLTIMSKGKEIEFTMPDEGKDKFCRITYDLLDYSIQNEIILRGISNQTQATTKNNQQNEIRQSKEDQSKLPPKLDSGNYYIKAINQVEERLIDEKKIESYQSIKVGKRSSKLSFPDLDLKDEFVDQDNRAQCSRKQLNIFWNQGRIEVLNTGRFAVETDSGTINPNQERKYYWQEDEEIIIAEEIQLVLKRR